MKVFFFFRVGHSGAATKCRTKVKSLHTQHFCKRDSILIAKNFIRGVLWDYWVQIVLEFIFTFSARRSFFISDIRKTRGVKE